MATAFVFPGQGSHTPDMRDQVAEWRPDLLALAEQVVGTDPFARAAGSTRYAQPAIFCASLAGLARLRAEGEQPDLFAGHSLGEIGALVAAGAMSELDGLRVVARRGDAMAAAGERRGRAGSMLAVLGGDREAIEAEAARCVVSVANDNAPGQIVLSGARSNLTMASDRLEALGAKTRMLDVAGAFHSPFMADASGPFKEALCGAGIRSPELPVWSCSEVRPFTDPADVRELLAGALVRPVRWRETVEAMHAHGVDRFVEVGPGRVLSGLVKRTLRAVAHA
jgi:malonyl CoA-acyl carrier protein transacylase